MCDEFLRIDLQDKPLKYAQERLKHGRVLTQLILDRLELGEGNWWTFFGPDQRPKNLERFQASTFDIGPEEAKQLPEYPNTVASLVEIIYRHLTSRPDAVCVFEDAISDPSDRWLQSSVSRRMVCNDTVLFFVTAEDESREKIRMTILEAQDVYPGLAGCMSSLPEEIQLPTLNGRISVGDLQILVERTTHLIVSAFDSEAYLIWEPNVRPPT